MERFKIFATSTGSKGFALTHWSKLSKTGENLEPACGSVGDGWTVSEENKTYEVDGQSFTLSNLVNCRRCTRKYGC